MSITLAIKPKYPTRKAVDKVLVNEGNFVDLVEVSAVRQAQALFDTSFVAMVIEDTYYPLTEENVAEQYELVNAGEEPTVEAKDDFGFRKLDTFFTSDQVECYNGLLKGDVEYADGKYIVKLAFDTEAATAAGYSEVKLNGIAVKAENTIEFKNAEALIAGIFGVTAKFTQGDVTEDYEFSFDNKLNPVVVNVENATVSVDTSAIEVDGVACDSFDTAWAKAVASNGTITINKAVEATGTNYALENGENVTIKLNNGSLTIVNTKTIVITDGTLVFDGNGTVTGAKQYVAQINGKGSVVVAKGVTLSGPKWAAITTGATATGANVIIHGTLEGLYYGFSSNGTSVGNVFVCDGTLKSTADEGEEPLGAYLAGDGEYTFTNATVETAGTGIELRAGTLNIKGGTITSTCTQDATMHAGGNGSCAVATGISVTQHSTKKKLDVNVEDVVVKAKAVIFEGNPSSYPTATEDTTINVVSGTFAGEVKTLNKDSDCKGFLKGGRYSVAPDEAYIAKGFKAVETSMGSFEIVAE